MWSRWRSGRLDAHADDPGFSPAIVTSLPRRRRQDQEIARSIAASGVPTLIVMEGGHAVADLGTNVAAFLSGF